MQSDAGRRGFLSAHTWSFSRNSADAAAGIISSSETDFQEFHGACTIEINSGLCHSLLTEAFAVNSRIANLRQLFLLLAATELAMCTVFYDR